MIRRLSRALTRATLPVGLLLVSFAAADAVNDDSEPLFSYYVLSLSWLPTLCLEQPQSDWCRGVQNRGFVLNGLWPHRDYASHLRCNVRGGVTDAIIQSMSDLLPTRPLVEREWQEHGTCSGLEPNQYFAVVRQAYESVVIPLLLNQRAAPPRTFYDVIKAFRRTNNSLAPQTITVTCSSGTPARLEEVRICLERNLGARYCSGDIISSGCRTLNISIPPLT
jgi:ribonuclease T2